MDQLTHYIIALSNLYGMVPRDKVVEIYNSQNEDQINSGQVDRILANPPKDLFDAFVFTKEDYFVIETILEEIGFDSMLRKKAGKPYYIPEKNELLNYFDQGYFEKSKEYNDLLNYLRENFFEAGDEKAQWLAEDIQGMCQFGAGLQSIFNLFNDRKIDFEDRKQMSELVGIITELSNNTRIWENNGHTSMEIFEKYEKHNLRALPDQPFDFNETDIIASKTRKKIGRNDPCPCGSGKKYKKCCLGKDGSF